MKILIINGSHRKNGATASILNEISLKLMKYRDVEVEVVHLADLKLNFCIGCCSCYKTGKCIYDDDIEELSRRIKGADGLILGSPTYASNVSAQMKLLIDRGHFVMEQLLYGKYAMSVATYENYGGKDTSKVLNKLLQFSGAQISGSIVSKSVFNINPMKNSSFKKSIHRKVHRFYRDIAGKHTYMVQSIKHFVIFQIGIKPFVLKKDTQYEGVLRNWRERKIVELR